MSAFITEVNTKNIFIKRLYPEVKGMFTHLCPYIPFVMTILFSNLWCFGSLLKTVMPKLNAQAGSMVGTTCSFNEINTNKKEKYCHSKAFLRPVKEEDLEKDLEEIKKIAKKYDIELVPAENNECFKATNVNNKSVQYTKECINEMIKIANDKGFIVSYNHPTWSLENATDYLNYKNLWAVEIYNHSCWITGLYEYDINVYDDLLRSGSRLGCIAGDDSHSLKSTCGGYVMINADKLEYDSIMNALENYNFYASTGPVIKELYVEDDKAYLTFEKGEYATMSTKGRRVEKQEATDVNGENKVCFTILPEDGYIRFDVVDKYGKRANTCAYFLD
jgi:hypothetical protein